MSLDERAWRVEETADYLCSRGYENVTLQFPDSALQYAARVAVAVQAACAARGHAVQVRAAARLVCVLGGEPRTTSMLSEPARYRHGTHSGACRPTSSPTPPTIP